MALDAYSSGRRNTGGNPNVVVVFTAVFALFVVLVAYVWLKNPVSGTLLAQLPTVATEVTKDDKETTQSKPKTNPEGEALLDEVLAKPLDTQEPDKGDSTQKPADKQLVPAKTPADTGKAAPMAGPPAPTSLPPSETVSKSLSGQDYSYTLKPGETLFSLASRFNNPAANLREANGLKEDNVQSGQVIILKVQAIHRVVSGQTLSWLARKYGVSMADLRKANTLKAEQINIGQELIIPIP